MNEHTAYIGLGSNLGDRITHLAKARTTLATIISLVRVSSLYETEPIEMTEQPWFINQVLEARCTMPPFQLLDACLTFEQQLGRVRKIPKGPRTIDIDLLFFDHEVMDKAWNGLSVIIPHPRLHLRKFVLVPLCELAPDYLHPILGKTVRQLLSDLRDPSVVRSIAPTG